MECGCYALSGPKEDPGDSEIVYCFTHAAAEEMRGLLQELVEEENAHHVLYGKDMVHFTLMDKIRSVLKKPDEYDQTQ